MMRSIKWILGSLAGLLFIGSAFFAIYFSIAMPAGPEAVAAMRSTDSVTITDQPDEIILTPSAPSMAGLIFYPGARVSPAAYAALLRPVAEHGYAVFIVKFPLNLAIFGVDRAGGIIAAHPRIHKWMIGGHSMGGAFATSFLAGRSDVQGLLLYASYPAADLSTRKDLVAVSIYGTKDGLATIEKVDRARPMMPPQTRYVPIEGGIHSFFGDYGLQPGDGQPTISREDASRQIIGATIAAMEELEAR